MSWLLLGVIASGFAIGYLVVNAFLSPPRAAPREDPQPGDRTAPPRHWTEVLGVPASADATQLSAAYRRAIEQHRPDQAEALAPEQQAIARQRTAEIEAAYLEAMRGLGR